MIKKIKELTKEERIQICDKHINCYNCPFLIEDDPFFNVDSPFVCKDDDLDKYGNEEIDILKYE